MWKFGLVCLFVAGASAGKLGNTLSYTMFHIHSWWNAKRPAVLSSTVSYEMIRLCTLRPLKCISVTVPAYSSSSAGASAGSSTGSGSYSSKYGSTYGSNYPYVGGYSSNYVGGGYGAPVIYPVVPPYAGFGFNNDLQHFINSYFNALQSNFARLLLFSLIY